jgi:quinoprotein dehydrogenase-associated probable ABC transporter substrate-binding protein
MSSAFRNVAVFLAVFVLAACSEPSRVLRVCADPNNLPFSNDELEGFENRIASLIGEELEARIEYVWWAQRRGFIRNTLREGRCDAVMGVPADFEMTRTTAPYYRSSYVFVTRQGAHQPASFDDPFLATATIGVHLIGDDFANSPPAHALSARGLINNVRGYSIYGDYKRPNPPAELVRAVADGQIDVAVAWGPLAGYFARSSPVPLQLTRVHPDEEPPFPFVFDVAMGVARSNEPLQRELDGVIARRRADIENILRDYGVPMVKDDRRAAR